MDPLGELLASDHRRTLEFFVMNLKDVSEPTVDQQELLYNASVLAHYAQISIDTDSPMAAPADLTAVFDHFVADMNVLDGSAGDGNRGRAVLVARGVFRRSDAPTAQHSLVRRAGRRVFPPRRCCRAVRLESRNCSTPSARHFEPWRRRHARLSHELRDSPYLISRHD